MKAKTAKAVKRSKKEAMVGFSLNELVQFSNKIQDKAAKGDVDAIRMVDGAREIWSRSDGYVCE